jgi:hypothetical protein
MQDECGGEMHKENNSEWFYDSRFSYFLYFAWTCLRNITPRVANFTEEKSLCV